MNLTTIDLGNYNLKYSGEVRGIVSSKYHTRFEVNEEAFNRIELDGKKYFIGVGKYSLEYTKANKESLVPQVLYCINSANKGNNINTNLCLLLPIAQMRFKEYIISIFQKRFFKCKINGKQIYIRIEKVIVLPECQTSRISLSEEINSNELLLIDIGSRTTNIAAYNLGNLVINITRKIGILNLY